MEEGDALFTAAAIKCCTIKFGAIVDQNLLGNAEHRPGRIGLNKRRNAHTFPMTSSVKRAPKKARTWTSLIDVTIYQTDLEPSPRGRKLLEALEDLPSATSPGSDRSF